MTQYTEVPQNRLVSKEAFSLLVTARPSFNSVFKPHQFKEGHVKYSEINLEREIKAIKLERSLVKYLLAVS